MNKYDLIVCGGGFAGCGAALAAAREGLSVLIVDKANCLGGAACTNLVNPFMPNSTRVTDENGNKHKKELSGGIFLEIVEKLDQMGAYDAKREVFHDEYLKIILNRMMTEAGVDLLFHSYISSVSCTDGEIKNITIATKSGEMVLEADWFIDATGDADIAYYAGFPTQLGREADSLCQPMTLCFRVANVDMEKYIADHKNANEKYMKLKAEGKIKNVRENLLIFRTMVDGMLHFNSTRIVKHNPVDAIEVTKAEIEVREQVFELFEFMKQNCDGFQNAQIVSTASEIGVRESRMIVGDFVLNEQHLLDCEKFSDAIAASNYEIDIHNPEGSGTSHYFFPEGSYYTIPYRALIPKNSKNLLVAGRCLSSTHEAQASYRIMPVCCCVGQAAGTAVAIAEKSGKTVSEIDIKELQNLLRKNGAFFGD